MESQKTKGRRLKENGNFRPEEWAYKRSDATAASRRAAITERLKSNNCNQQLQSSLFKILITGIRKKIWNLVLQPDLHSSLSEEEVIEKLGNPFELWGKDGIRCTVDTALLLVCRLLYTGAKFLPLHNGIHHFYRFRWNPFDGSRNSGGFFPLSA